LRSDKTTKRIMLHLHVFVDGKGNLIIILP
jgi:hypothetical protein